ncbi:GntR family transcriptional regulator [Nesterenkonia alba]|uniref:GntR family transcriptional regulator n=1 Tax=Nesterenkonia alba TaxID=515814 RepID=UPI0003B523D4|nr:GntR family transcriptional regulator [Nesterenkonia alba]
MAHPSGAHPPAENSSATDAPAAVLPEFTPAPEGPTAIHLQISEWLSDLIESGQLAEGTRLPTERDFSRRLGVSRMTLRQALQTLELRGLIRRTHGRKGGSFVTSPAIKVDLATLPGLAFQIQESRQRPGSIVRQARLQQASAATASALNLHPGDEVYFIDRIRLADGSPIARERSYFPAALLPDFLDQDLEGSLYSLLRRYGHGPTHADEQLSAVLAGDDGSSLEIAPDRPVLLRVRHAHTAEGIPIEYSRDVFRTDRVQVTSTSRIG